MFTVLDFDGLNITGPICHLHTGTALGVVGASATTEVTPLTPAQVITTAAVTANADNQAFIAQQAAATTALAATIPTNFNLNNLPAKAKACYENHLNTTYLMSNSDM